MDGSSYHFIFNMNVLLYFLFVIGFILSTLISCNIFLLINVNEKQIKKIFVYIKNYFMLWVILVPHPHTLVCSIVLHV